jgi:2-methylcitrate dehydratase PrpD
MGETRILTDYLARATYEDLPKHVVDRAKTSIADTIACGLGGRKTREGDVLVDMMKYLGGKGQATVFGDKSKLPFEQAAQVNRVLANMLDYDDTHMMSGHMSSALVPTALNMGERVRASGKEMINAVVLGYEVVSRIRRAVNPTEEVFWTKFERVDSGLHFGVTVVAGKLLGLSSDQMADAFGLAGLMRTWRITFPDRAGKGMPPWMKITGGDHLIPGLHSALLAHRGFPGDRTILDRGKGYEVSVGSDRYNPDALTANLGEEYETLRIGYKFYSSCRHTSAAADAVAALMSENSIKADDVEQVIVKAQKRVADNFAIYEPEYMIQAQFSLPYVVTMVLLNEPTGPNWYGEDMLRNPKVRALAHRVKLETDPAAGHKFYAEYKSTSTVEIATKAGKRFSKHVEYPRGEPENPFKPEDHVTKLRNMATCAGLETNRIDKLIRTLGNLDTLKSVRALGRLLVPEGD